MFSLNLTTSQQMTLSTQYAGTQFPPHRTKVPWMFWDTSSKS